MPMAWGCCGITPGQRCTRRAEQVAGLAALRGHFPAIEHRQGFRVGIPVEKESAAPQPGALGFHHRQHRLGAHQGIDGTATRLQCSDSRFCGEGIGGHHHRAAAGGDTVCGRDQRFPDRRG